MKWSWFGRAAMGLLSAMALGLGMTACGGGTIAYLWTVAATSGSNAKSQVIGYRVDDYTGNLTAAQNSPFTGQGSNPVYVLVKPGGRYVYVVNQGSTTSTSSNSSDSGIAVFSVGGTGALTFQQSYDTKGFDHVWAQFDGSGGFLYVLDKYSPKYQPDPTKPNFDVNGALTTFSVDANTGRLIVVAQNLQTPSGGTAPTFVEVGNNPIMMASTGPCLFTLNKGGSPTSATAVNPSSITPFSIASGQLGTVTTGSILPNFINPTSINGNSQYMVVTDAGLTTTTNGVTTFNSSGTIYPFNVAQSCSLTSFSAASIPNNSAVSNPVYSYLDTSSKYLFILNGSVNTSNPNTPYSQITGYNIVNNQLTENTNSPFNSGSGPTCMIEDPTAKFMYVANANDGTVTGYDFDSTRGTLSPLQRGSSFNTGATGLHCIALSGSVN